MANKNTGRNWTRRSIEEIFDDMFAKKGVTPTPTGQGDIFALLNTNLVMNNNAPSGLGFKGYNSFAPSGSYGGTGTFDGRYCYKNSGIGNTDALCWRDDIGPSGIEGLIWHGLTGDNSRLLYAPQNGSSTLYSVSYYGSEVFISYIHNITLNYQATTAIPAHTYTCQCFNHTMANNLHTALQACPEYGTGSLGFVILMLTSVPNPLQYLTDDDLLTFANSILSRVASTPVDTVVRV